MLKVSTSSGNTAMIAHALHDAATGKPGAAHVVWESYPPSAADLHEFEVWLERQRIGVAKHVLDPKPAQKPRKWR